ncbi:MAG: valine--tRNA ligase [Actinobacteria bacterium]|nr:valine--tRNA ligase [Actinomycetota bacterium]
MSELPKAYDPKAVEGELYADWVEAGLFHAEPDDEGEPFSIVIPPPNVTGSLHVGHALDNTIQDAIIRRERMLGKNAVWVPGTDHAGIATQNVVEKQLAEEGTDRHELGREAFIERAWRWREESGGEILNQLRKLGASCDWEREAFTFDEPRSRAVRETFVSLYEQDLIYRGNRLINWCPRCATALSDIEVEHEETVGELARFRYEYADGSGGIEVATTRVETMLGDTAIAVHPDDDRYRDVVGRTVVHPFDGRELPIIADDYVDPEFGSGAVKITPAHDPNDHDIGQRHDLPTIDVMTDDARIGEAGGAFAGMDRFEARAAIKAALDERGLMVGVDPHTHQVGHCSRCGTVVEPRLSDQWFVKVRPLADKAAAAVRDGRITFVPESRAKPFLEWLDNLHDWCISRQIWWGHRIPAWYGPDGELEVSREDLDREGWVQDEDVLDTWFSSQLWPMTVLGWEQPGDHTPEFDTWFPTSTLVTGYDINTFWVSRMAMISLWLEDEVPFRIVHNHGLVRDEHGKKMSKSFGNVIDPLDLVSEFGADATRFALLRSAAPGVDVPLAVEWVDGEKKFANKLWNATRFALSTLDGTTPGELPDTASLPLEDRWILSRLEDVRAQVDEAYDGYEWAIACRTLRSFAWDELADWYLEAAKVRLYGDDEGAKADARAVLAVVLDDLLRLLHPLMPFVTEALWRSLTGAAGGAASLMVAAWPTARTERDAAAEEEFSLVQDLVTEIRKFRSQNDVAPSRRFGLAIQTSARDRLAPHLPLIVSLAGLEEVTFVDGAVEEPGTSRIVFSAGECFVDLTGLIDVGAELARLDREVAKAREDLQRVEGKLGNASFVDRAPDAVVQKERDRRDDLTRVIDELSNQAEQLRQLEA